MALELAGEADAASAVRRRIGYAGAPLSRAIGLERARAGDEDPFAGLLTPRELEIVRLVAGGRSNREVALTLGVSVKLIEKHLSSIFRKLDVRTRGQLAARFAAASAEQRVVVG